MKRYISAIIYVILIMFSGCSKQNSAEAYGTFTATEYYPASEVTGKIISFTKDEGDKVEENEIIAILDTTDIQLQINEMITTIELKELMAQNRNNDIAVIDQQLENLMIDITRFQQLTTAEAAPEKNLDDLNASKKVLKLKKESAILARQGSIKEMELARIKLDQLKSRKDKYFLKSPIKGTLLNKYFETGEIVPAGKAYAKIADLDIMTAKVYISETQLPDIKLGNDVMLGIDTTDSNSHYFSGKVTYIAQQAEFTPKIIQTKEQRVKLVYEVEIQCSNNGELKIGMPVTMLTDKHYEK